MDEKLLITLHYFIVANKGIREELVIEKDAHLIPVARAVRLK
jgi:hypothetical protein